MNRVTTALMLSALMVYVPTIAWSQDGGQEKKPQPSTLSGRVTIDGKPVARATVTLIWQGGGSPGESPRTQSDAEGNYRLTILRAGRYLVNVGYPGYIAASEADTFRFNGGKMIVVDEGDTLTDIDFELKRGGVITGRITDASGRPVIGTQVSLMRADPQGRVMPFYPMSFPQSQQGTDDRGEYRIYGLPAGRYRVGVGQGASATRIPMRGGFYAQTYYPGVTDEAKAELVDVTEGSEVTNINISFGSPETTYSLIGRVVDAATGKPVPGVFSGYGAVVTLDGRQRLNLQRPNNEPTNARGEFRIEGLSPGRYAAFLMPRGTAAGEGNLFSDPVTFEVKDADVGGIEIKAYRGAMVSGTVVFEGEDAAKLLQQFMPLTIHAGKREERFGTLAIPAPVSPARVAADGSFTLSNVQPGNIYIAASSNKGSQGLRPLRLEVNGEDRHQGIEVKSGEHLTGVRLVLAYWGGVIRGNVKIENGSLPENTRVYAVVNNPAGGPPPSVNGSEVDQLGRFQFQGLKPGEYEVEIRVGPARSYSPSNSPPQMPRIRPVKQLVRVTNEAETRISLVLDLSQTTDR